MDARRSSISKRTPTTPGLANILSFSESNSFLRLSGDCEILLQYDNINCIPVCIIILVLLSFGESIFLVTDQHRRVFVVVLKQKVYLTCLVPAPRTDERSLSPELF